MAGEPDDTTLRRVALLEERVRLLSRVVGVDDPAEQAAEKRSIAERVRALEGLAEALARRS